MFVSKIGEIKKINSVSKDAKSRIGIVLAVDEPSGSAIMGLMTNLTEIATERDVLLTSQQINAEYDLCLLSDFVGRVALTQIDNNICLGKIEASFVEEFLEVRSSKPFGQIYLNGFTNGKYFLQENDSVWNWRLKEFKNWSKLVYKKSQNSKRHSIATIEAFETNQDKESILEMTSDSLRLVMLARRQ